MTAAVSVCKGKCMALVNADCPKTVAVPANAGTIIAVVKHNPHRSACDITRIGILPTDSP
jgi:hypothetical protein